jgi:hypothetical protein
MPRLLLTLAALFLAGGQAGAGTLNVTAFPFGAVITDIPRDFTVPDFPSGAGTAVLTDVAARWIVHDIGLDAHFTNTTGAPITFTFQPTFEVSLTTTMGFSKSFDITLKALPDPLTVPAGATSLNFTAVAPVGSFGVVVADSGPLGPLGSGQTGTISGHLVDFNTPAGITPTLAGWSFDSSVFVTYTFAGELPEPATLIPACLGVLGLLGWRRLYGPRLGQHGQERLDAHCNPLA